MNKIKSGISRKLPGFLDNQSGTATVESVLWFPIFLLLFGLMIDCTMIFHGQSDVLRVVQDANRNLSIGRFTTDLEVESYITATLDADNITVSTADAEIDTTSGIVSTTVVVPMGQLQLLGFFSSLTSLEVSVTAEHMLENWQV